MKSSDDQESFLIMKFLLRTNVVKANTILSVAGAGERKYKLTTFITQSRYTIFYPREFICHLA